MKKYLALALVLMLFSCDNEDDTTVDACVEVTEVQSNNINTNSATISWMDSNEAESYIVEYGISGFATGTGTTIEVTTTSVDLVGLISQKTYDVYVTAVCSEDNSSLYSDVHSFTTETLPIIPEFRPNLSELNLFSGDLSDLNISPKAFEYQLNSQLFTDYAIKQRLIALPENTSMEFDGDGLPIFPDNTVIAKTFYYNNNETNLALGRTIIETRLLIKIEGSWETGDYKWNDTQTEATLDLNGSTLPISWVDSNGDTNSINYEIPSNTDCFTCHSSFNRNKPIGPKLRSMNFDINGVNQLDDFINNGYLTGIASSSAARVLPNWEDTSLSLEDRARAYIDINCAHCHIPGGSCFDQSTLNLAFETTLEESLIADQSPSIELRVSTNIEGISMPLIGTTILHDEGVQLVLDYLNSIN